MIKKYWWLLPLGIIGYIAYSKLKLAKNFIVNFDSIDFSNFQLFNPQINLVLSVVNPTTTTADVQSVTGVLTVDGQRIGNVSSPINQVLQTGANYLNIPIKLDVPNILSLIAIITKDKFSYSFVGNVTVDYVAIPVNYSYTV